MGVDQFKKGDTFVLAGAYQENKVAAPLPTGIRIQVRDAFDTLIADLAISRDDEAGGLYSSKADTADWPLGMTYLDVLYTYSDGSKHRTPTAQFKLVPAITHD